MFTPGDWSKTWRVKAATVQLGALPASNGG